MRTIKFRGKRVDNGEWVEGNICALSDGVFILEEYNCGNINEPEYHYSGMGCGLEDRRITDRYDAMYHGWESCIERYADELPCFIEVIPETVGQFTGLTDKNGKEIFEDDVLTVDLFNKTFQVVFAESEKWGASFQHKSHNSIFYLTKYFTDTSEVIGNIHDNPELL